MNFDEFRSLARQAEELARPSLLLREQLGLTESTVARQLREAQERATLASQFLTGIGGPEGIRALSAGVEEWHRQEKLRELIEGPTSSLARAAQGYLASPTMRAAMGYMDSPSVRTARDYLDSDTMRAARGLIESPTMIFAREAAERASALAMPTALAQYRVTATSLSERMSLLEPNRMMHDGVALEAFARSAAMSDALALATRVDRGILDAARVYTATTMPDLGLAGSASVLSRCVRLVAAEVPARPSPHSSREAAALSGAPPAQCRAPACDAGQVARAPI